MGHGEIYHLYSPERFFLPCLMPPFPHMRDKGLEKGLLGTLQSCRPLILSSCPGVLPKCHSTYPFLGVGSAC